MSDRYTEHLHTRFSAGITDAATLPAELPRIEFTGGAQAVRRWVQPPTAVSPSVILEGGDP